LSDEKVLKKHQTAEQKKFIEFNDHQIYDKHQYPDCMFLKCRYNLSINNLGVHAAFSMARYTGEGEVQITMHL